MKLYREIVRNTEMGAQSIKNLLPYMEDEKLKTLICRQKDGLNDFCAKAKSCLDSDEQEQAEGNKFQKTMLKAGVAMNAMMNSDNTHVASMLIEGYNMGLVSVQKCMNEVQKDGCEVPPLGGEVIKFYDKCIKELRTYL